MAGTQYARRLAVNRQFLLVEDVDLISEIISSLPRDRQQYVVEIGAGSGTVTSSILGTRCDKLTLLTIDNNADNIMWARRALQDANLAGCDWHTKVSESWRAAHPCDALFIDGDHTYEGVSRDIYNWFLYLENETPVWFHDYSHPDHPGVRRAVQEAAAEGLLRYVKEAGWGVWTAVSK